MFSDGNDDDKFAMHPENGNIVIAKSLDWETQQQYNLTLEASDTVNTVQTWVSQPQCAIEAGRLSRVLEPHTGSFRQGQHSINT